MRSREAYAMRKAFIEYLTSEGVIVSPPADKLHTMLRRAPEPIGAIAFSYGMLTGGDIDRILDEQRDTHEPFGEIAMKYGMLTQEQVEALLKVQQVRAASEIAEALALSGHVPIEEVCNILGRFLIENSAAPQIVKG
jgi:hypothetical protein